MKLGALFEQQSPACFSFRYMDQAGADPSPDADYNAVMRGCISHSVLDYSFLGA